MDTPGQTRRVARALIVAAALALAPACSDASDYIGQPGEQEDNDDMALDEQFQQLMQRPDIEQVVERYNEMLAEIRTILNDITDLPEDWEHLDSQGSKPGCAISFPDVGVWDVETQFMDRWRSRGPLADEEWPTVRDTLHDIAGEYGFDTVTQDIYQAGRRSYKLADDYGAQLSFSSEDYTSMDVVTGCHLYPDAKDHGEPRPRPDDLGGS